MSLRNKMYQNETWAPVAIVDDDPTQRILLRALITRSGYSTVEHASANSLLTSSIGGLGAICLDLGLDDASGLELLEHLRATYPEIPIIVITGNGEVATAVSAMRAGAYDYLVKPIEEPRLLSVLQRAFERRALTAQVQELAERLVVRSTTTLIGISPAISELRRQIAKIAQSNVAVCIRGETGSGKELVARAIHEVSARKAAPFVAVNCAAIPASLQESELFGHERGAFTGATATHRGRFEQADRGSLFLDELGEMAAGTQAALLRAIQERMIRRVGASQEIPIDVRIISATHRDLETEVREGRFREDLYYRLVVYPIEVPPLRARLEDIPLLVGAFLSKLSADAGLTVRRVSPDVIDALQQHSWPGNVRELQNVVHRAMLACEGEELQLSDLTPMLRPHTRKFTRLASAQPASDSDGGVAPVPIVFVPASPAESSPSVATASPLPVPQEVVPMEQLKRDAIVNALLATNGNVARAARLLQLGRATLYRRIVELQLDVSGIRHTRT